MPLTPEEKNQIAQGTAVVAQAGVGGIGPVTAAPFGVAALPFLAFAPPLIGLAALFGRQRFPKGPTEKELFGPISALEARGLEARISRDPFFGTTVISTADQEGVLEGLVQNAAVRRLLAKEDFSGVLAFRQGVVQGLAETAQERGFARTIDPSFRGGVFRETAQSPLQVVER